MYRKVEKNSEKRIFFWNSARNSLPVFLNATNQWPWAQRVR